jgi:hypothetical protein
MFYWNARVAVGALAKESEAAPPSGKFARCRLFTIYDDELTLYFIAAHKSISCLNGLRRLGITLVSAIIIIIIIFASAAVPTFAGWCGAMRSAATTSDARCMHTGLDLSQASTK